VGTVGLLVAMRRIDIESPGRTAIGGLIVCVVALLACGGGVEFPAWKRIGNEMYAVNCYRIGTCYARAAYVCPFGFEALDGERTTAGDLRSTSTRVGNTIVTRTEDGETYSQMVVRCHAPRFCAQQQDCPFGSKCTPTKRYPGKAACSIR
jgi:hypothetical protein